MANFIKIFAIFLKGLLYAICFNVISGVTSKIIRDLITSLVRELI